MVEIIQTPVFYPPHRWYPFSHHVVVSQQVGQGPLTSLHIEKWVRSDHGGIPRHREISHWSKGSKSVSHTNGGHCVGPPSPSTDLVVDSNLNVWIPFTGLVWILNTTLQDPWTTWILQVVSQHF